MVAHLSIPLLSLYPIHWLPPSSNMGPSIFIQYFTSFPHPTFHPPRTTDNLYICLYSPSLHPPYSLHTVWHLPHLHHTTFIPYSPTPPYNLTYTLMPSVWPTCHLITYPTTFRIIVWSLPSLILGRHNNTSRYRTTYIGFPYARWVEWIRAFTRYTHKQTCFYDSVGHQNIT